MANNSLFSVTSINDGASGVDFSFEPTNFYNAELYLKQAIDSLEEAMRIVSQIDGSADVLDTSRYNLYVSCKNKLNNIYSELEIFKKKMAGYKEQMISLDPSFESVFEYLENSSGYNSSYEMLSHDNNSENMVSQTDTYFAAVLQYDQTLEEYTKQLNDLKKKISGIKGEKTTFLSGASRASQYSPQYNDVIKEKTREYDEKIKALEEEYNSLSSAMVMIKTLRDYSLESAYNSYMLYDDFDLMSSNSRVASYYSSYSGLDGYHHDFYDMAGKKIEDFSYWEVAMYFYTSGVEVDFFQFHADVEYYYNTLKYLTDDERKILTYFINTQDNEKIDEYMNYKQDAINQRKGQELAAAVIEKIDGYYSKVGENKDFNDYFEDGLFATLADVFSNNYTYSESDAYRDTLELLAKEGFFDGVGNFFDGFANLFGADGIVSPEQYKTSFLMQELKKRYGEKTIASMFSTGTYEISNSIGNMAPSMVVGLVTGPLAGSLLMGVSSVGNAREQALQNGMSEIQAWLYGVLSGASETTLGYFLGGIPFLSKVDDIPGIKGFFAKMAKEGFEEFTQAILDPMFEALVTGNTADINWGDVLKSGIYGAITAGILNGGTVVISGVTCSLNGTLSSNKLAELVEKYKDKDLSNKAVAAQLIKDLGGDPSKVEMTNNSNDLFSSVENNDSKLELNSSIESIQAEVNKLNYNKTTFPKYISNYLASNMRKFLYKDTSAFHGLNDQIMENGLYHFTGAADAILNSGYIKSSNMNASYGTRKTFFFNGVPDVGAFATNLDSIPIKATAVKVKATSDLVNSSKLKLRYFDDMAITYEGKFNLAGYETEKCYFGLVVEDGALVYKQISEQEYNAYEDTNMGKVLSDYVSKKDNVTDIKGNFLADISYRIKNNNAIDSNEVEAIVSKNLHNVDSVHGIQLSEKDFGGFIAANIERGFFTPEQVNLMLSNINNKGYISAEAGEYYSSLFNDSDYDVYVKTIHSNDLNSIMSEGVRCLGTSTSGYGTAPTDISQIKLGNTVSKVDGVYDLFCTLKGANGISQGMNLIDGTLILKIPKGADVNDILYFSETSGTYCIKPEFIDCFSQVDNSGVVSEPVFNNIGDSDLNFVEEEVSNIAKIMDPALIEAGIKDGSITKTQIQTELNNLIGDKLSSWVLSEDAAVSLYTNLLKACNGAGISITDVKTSVGIMEAMAKYYADARDNLHVDTAGEIFNTYRTHGIVHIFDVMTQSINAYSAFKNSGISNLSLETIMLSAVMHDTGMSGGKQIKLTTDENGNLVIKTVDIASDGTTYRESHSFNSAVNILNEYKTLREAGYTDVQIAEAALLTFAHSKSNSGLNPLSDNSSGWSFAVQALAKATEGSEFNLVDVLVKSGALVSSDTIVSQNKITIKTPDGKVDGNVGVYNINENWLKTMSYEALIIRLGDALTNNDNAETNQYGKKITFKSTNYNDQRSFSQILKQFEIDSSLPVAQQFAILKEKLTIVAGYEAQGLTYEVDGEIYNGSQQFVLGENNQTYDLRNAADGNVEVVISVKNSDAIPFCTLFAIDERAGELNSKGNGIFGTTDAQGIKMVIEIDESASTEVKELYQQYADYYNAIDGKVPVEIKEVSVSKNVKYQYDVSNAKATLYNINPKLVELYDNGVKTGRNKEFFLGFEEHNFVHVTRVAEASVQLLSVFDQIIESGKLSGYGKIDSNIVYLAGLAHDLGMKSGGYVSFKDGSYASIAEVMSNLSKYENQIRKLLGPSIKSGMPLTSVMDLEGRIIRAQHPLNSAITILQNSDIFGSDSELVACLALIHSKSTSGVRNVSSYSELSSMVKLLYEGQICDGTKVYDFDASKLVKTDSSGKPLTQIISENGTDVEVYIFNEGVVEAFRTGAVALRVGDAHANKTGFNHGGGDIIIEKTSDGISTLENPLLPISDLCDQEAAEAQIKISYSDEVLELAGGSYEFSKRIVLGERNAYTMDTKNADGTLVYTHVVKTTDAPACTWEHGISEKFGEYKTFKDVSQKVVVQLPADSSIELVNFYKQQAMNYMDANNWLIIEVVVNQ